ncbi:MAG: hypothetical protein N2Z68_01815 [Patescibacteria group bacterium]|nr:hypothetical protein [Patescibacteria group bacterium]
MNRKNSFLSLVVAVAALAAMALLLSCGGGGDGGYPLGPGPTPTVGPTPTPNPNPTPTPTPTPPPNTFDVKLISFSPPCGSELSFGKIVEAVISYTSSEAVRIQLRFVFGENEVYSIGMDGSTNAVPAGSGTRTVRGMIDFQKNGKGRLQISFHPLGGGFAVFEKDLDCYFDFK